MAFRIKIAVKVADSREQTARRREAAKALIKTHGGTDGSRAHGGKFVVGVFPTKEAAKAFRAEARKAVGPAG